MVWIYKTSLGVHKHTNTIFHKQCLIIDVASPPHRYGVAANASCGAVGGSRNKSRNRKNNSSEHYKVACFVLRQMQASNLIAFEYSYLSLPETMYSIAQPSAVGNAEVVLFNSALCNALQIEATSDKIRAAILDAAKNTSAKCYAQAYAGHQFGSFTNLGDGRALMLGELVAANNQRYDVQLKGSGRTMYSRRGDGKATLRAMLREYLISQAMSALQIPTSRSVAVLKTEEPVVRESLHEGAILVRLMKSHLRVGTFEYAARLCHDNELQLLTEYAINRLYPEAQDTENPVLSFLNAVIQQQLHVVAQWMRVGFIHGVMNTDNTAISGETFDYGPCAFMNSYHPGTVYSSIDTAGRYAFARQPNIILWNLARFAETLIPLLHSNEQTALQLAQDAVDSSAEKWSAIFYSTMLKKIGLQHIAARHTTQHITLLHELLQHMQQHKLDYTNTFVALAQQLQETSAQSSGMIPISSELQPWIQTWKHTIESTCGTEQALQIMCESNPVYIPRNHLVEQALLQAERGDFQAFNALLSVLSQPYQFAPNAEEFMQQPQQQFENTYQTFCGT